MKVLFWLEKLEHCNKLKMSLTLELNEMRLG